MLDININENMFGNSFPPYQIIRSESIVGSIIITITEKEWSCFTDYRGYYIINGQTTVSKKVLFSIIRTPISKVWPWTECGEQGAWIQKLLVDAMKTNIKAKIEKKETWSKITSITKEGETLDR